MQAVFVQGQARSNVYQDQAPLCLSYTPFHASYQSCTNRRRTSDDFRVLHLLFSRQPQTDDVRVSASDVLCITLLLDSSATYLVLSRVSVSKCMIVRMLNARLIRKCSGLTSSIVSHPRNGGGKRHHYAPCWFTLHSVPGPKRLRGPDLLPRNVTRWAHASTMCYRRPVSGPSLHPTALGRPLNSDIAISPHASSPFFMRSTCIEPSRSLYTPSSHLSSFVSIELAHSFALDAY